jgi:Trk K+ transport system NAD-binding subunit
MRAGGGILYFPVLMMASSLDALALLSSCVDQDDSVEINLVNASRVEQPVRALRLPGNCLVLAIRRGEELCVPRGNTELAYGDRLTVFGSLENGFTRRPEFIRGIPAA